MPSAAFLFRSNAPLLALTLVVLGLFVCCNGQKPDSCSPQPTWGMSCSQEGFTCPALCLSPFLECGGDCRYTQGSFQPTGNLDCVAIAIEAGLGSPPEPSHSECYWGHPVWGATCSQEGLSCPGPCFGYTCGSACVCSGGRFGPTGNPPCWNGSVEYTDSSADAYSQRDVGNLQDGTGNTVCYDGSVDYRDSGADACLQGEAGNLQDGQSE
jgi:hypothetical protein